MWAENTLSLRVSCVDRQKRFAPLSIIFSPPQAVTLVREVTGLIAWSIFNIGKLRGRMENFCPVLTLKLYLVSHSWARWQKKKIKYFVCDTNDYRWTDRIRRKSHFITDAFYKLKKTNFVRNKRKLLWRNASHFIWQCMLGNLITDEKITGGKRIMEAKRKRERKMDTFTRNQKESLDIWLG